MNPFLIYLPDIFYSDDSEVLISLKQKQKKVRENSELLASIDDMFFTFAKIQTEHLAKSDFNTRTCLVAGKLFEHAFTRMQPSDVEMRTRSKCSHSLRAYINTQTLLLAKLKYKYLKDSLLFFGTYYETMVQVKKKYFCDFLITNYKHNLMICLFSRFRL